MRRQASIGALLLIAVGVALGATVFRSDIAQATGLAQGVVVTNTPLPVREQNLDGGNIKVHEQGVAKVEGSVSIAVPVSEFSQTGVGGVGPLFACNPNGTDLISSISAANSNSDPAVITLLAEDGGAVPGPSLVIPAHDTVQLTFPQPFKMPGQGICLAAEADANVAWSVVGYKIGS